MKQSILLVALVLIIIVVGAGYYYVSSSSGPSNGTSSTTTTSAGASIDGVQIISDNVTKSIGTGTWQIALKNTGSLTVSSITAFLETPTRGFICSGAAPSDGLFFKNCPATSGAPLPPGSTVMGSSTGAGPASTTAGMQYPVAIHLAFSNGQTAWLNSTVIATQP
jgi:hypothetical protein